MFDDADKFLKIAVGLGVLAAGGGIGYHYGFYLPELERQKIERAEQAKNAESERLAKMVERAAQIKRVEQAQLSVEAAERRSRYRSCRLDEAVSYSKEWNLSCTSAGEGKECSLPLTIANRITAKYEAGQRRCLDESKLGI